MSTAHRFPIGVVSALVLLSIPCGLIAAAGRHGSLDPSFSLRGRIILTDFNGGTFESAYALAIQPDGRIVTAGFSAGTTTGADVALARYESSGDLDGSFGAGGKVVTDFGGSTDTAYAVAVDVNGQIVVAGYAYPSGRSDTDFAVARYNADGRLDTLFNSTGKVLTDFSGGGSTDTAAAVAIDPNGKIVVAGYSNAGGSYDFALARYNPDGTLDTTFNSTGKALLDFSGRGSGEFATALALEPDGNIVIAGLSDASGALYDFAVARFTPNGRLDETFNSGGILLTDFDASNDVLQALAIQPDGKIVAAGYSNAGGTVDFALARYNSDGSLDPTFNSSGKVLTDFGDSETQDQAHAVAIQSDGKIVATGESFGSAGNDFALARYNTDGTMDDTFNSSGQVVTRLKGFDVAYATAIQPDGKIVAAGFSDVSGTSDFALARYLP